jgi:hypothetical protein
VVERVALDDHVVDFRVLVLLHFLLGLRQRSVLLLLAVLLGDLVRQFAQSVILKTSA